jgi:hypothetical protein
MANEATVSRRKHVILFGALVIAAMAISWIEPFSKRYQGKTLNAWIDKAVQEDGLRADVVSAFGKEAMPELVAIRDRSHRIWRLGNKISAGTGRQVERFFRIRKRGYKIYDWLAVLRAEFSPSVPIAEVVRLGTYSAEAAAQTLFWYFNAAKDGTDDVTLIKTVRGMLLFQKNENLQPLMDQGGYTVRLYLSLIQDPDQISGVQFSPPDVYGGTSDQVVRVRINYRDGSSQLKTIVFKGTPFPEGDQWSARINIGRDAGGNFAATFAPIEPHPFRMN